MQKGLWLIAGCIVFGISLVAHAPARLVIPEQFGKLRLLGIEGSVWRGEVKQILYSGKALPIRTLHWTVRPTALLTGTLEAGIHEEQTPTNRGNIGLNLHSRQFEVQALHWQLPGSSLDSWFQAWLSVQGQFTLELQDMRLPANQFFPSELQGRLDWQDAALRVSSEYWPVGSPVIQFSEEGDAIKGVVTNSQPMLPGDGSFQCTMRSCQVELNLKPGPDAPQSLLNGLLLMGLQQAGDRFSGQVTLPLE